MQNRNSKSQWVARRAISAIAVLGLLALSGCSTSEPSAATQAGLAKVELHFDLNQCQDLGAGLYKCPASDKPFVTPITTARLNASESDRKAVSSSRAAPPSRGATVVARADDH